MAHLEQLVGVVVLAVALLDVFLTILYARLESGFLGMRFAHGITKVIVHGSRVSRRYRGRLISACGPIALCGVIALWFGLLTLGLALVVHPALGQGIAAPGDESSTDFLTALHVAGVSLSVVGSSGYHPTTDGYRLVFLVTSAIGMSFTSLTVTYLLQLYTALLRRNALGLKVHALSEDKGDGAELAARIGPRGHFDSGMSSLAEVAAEMSHVRESHHFYPLLLYFRFEEPEYSVSRMSNVALDAMTLLMSALDDEKHGWVGESAGVTHLWRSSRLMLEMLARSVDKLEEARAEPTAEDLHAWRVRFGWALTRLRAAGIAVVADEEAGYARYAALRARWDGFVKALAPEMAFSLEQVEPVEAKAAHAG